MSSAPAMDQAADFEAIVASTPDERAAAYRVRYSVYVGEQRKPYPDADHERCWLTDRLDANAAVILVTGTAGPCGTVRGCFADCEYVKETYEKQFALSHFSDLPDRSIAICSRLAVLHPYRATPVSRILFREIYRYGIGRDTRFTFEACAPRVRSIFVRYGFREYAPPYIDSVAGPLHRMLLTLDDLAHLERARSPFLSLAKELGVKHLSRPWLDKMIEDHNQRIGFGFPEEPASSPASDSRSFAGYPREYA